MRSRLLPLLALLIVVHAVQLIVAPIAAADQVATTTPAADVLAEPPANPKAVNLEEAMARELEPMELRAFASSDNRVTGRVECSSDPVVNSNESGYTIRWPLGDAGNFECTVLTESPDPGAWLMGIYDFLISERGREQTATIDVLPYGSVPCFELRLLFVEDGISRLANLFLLDMPMVPLGCVSEAFGYRETQRRVLGGLVESLELQVVEEPVANLEESIFLYSAQGVDLGFVVETVQPRGDGNFLMTTETSAVLPRKGGGIEARDSSFLEVSAPSGELLSKRVMSARNGTVETDLELARKPNGKYLVKGVYRGEKVKLSFKPSEKVCGEYGTRLELARFTSGESPPSKLVVETYVPHVKLDGPAATTYRQVGVSESGLPIIESTSGRSLVRSHLEEGGRTVLMEMMAPGSPEPVATFRRFHHSVAD